jgi:ATP-dependent exoDNAse (exonuclease V) beta subunit
MPSAPGASAEIEEEWWLLWVAMSRAKDDLHLGMPQRFFTHRQHAQGDLQIYANKDAVHSAQAYSQCVVFRCNQQVITELRDAGDNIGLEFELRAIGARISLS